MKLPKKVRKLINAARMDDEFMTSIKISMPDAYWAIFDTGSKKLPICGAIYVGWLIAKGVYNESDYE